MDLSFSEDIMDEYWFCDWEPSERWPHYTRANAGEVLAPPASPLGLLHGITALLSGGEMAIFAKAILPKGKCLMSAPRLVASLVVFSTSI